MEVVNEIVSTYIIPALGAAIVAAFTWLGAQLKQAYQEHINTKTKETVVTTVVKAVEQIYADLSGAERLQKALEAASSLLKEKGLSISDLELKMLIESAVQGLGHGFLHGEAAEGKEVEEDA